MQQIFVAARHNGRPLIVGRKYQMNIEFWQLASGLGVGAFIAALFYMVVKQFGREKGKGFETSKIGREATAILAVLIILIFGGITVLALVLYSPKESVSPPSRSEPTPTALKTTIARVIDPHSIAFTTRRSNKDSFLLKIPDTWDVNQPRLVDVTTATHPSLSISINASKRFVDNVDDLESALKAELGGALHEAGSSVHKNTLRDVRVTHEKYDQPEGEVVVEPTSTQIYYVPGYILDYEEFDNINNLPYRNLLIITFFEGAVYSVTMNAPVSLYTEYEQVFLTVCSSFSILKS